MALMNSTLTTDEWKFLDTSGGDNKDTNPNYLCVILCGDLGIKIKANLPQDFNIDIGAQYEEAIAQAMSSNQIVSELSSKARLAGVQLVTQALTAQVWQGSTEISFSLPLSFQVHKDEYEEVIKPLSDLYRLSLPGEATDGGFLTAPGPSLSAELMKKSIGAFTTGVVNVAKESGGATELVGKALGGVQNLVGSAYDIGRSAVSGAVKLVAPNSGSAGAAGANNVATAPMGEGQKAPLSSAITNNISLALGQYMHFDSVVITNVGQTHHVQPLDNGTMSRVDVTVTFKTFFVPTQKDIKTIFLGLSRGSANSDVIGRSINPQQRN
jgi:hypothetical protein